jgi:hypothetical protein
MSISVRRVPVPGGTHVLMAQIVDLVVDVVDLVLELVAEMQDVAILGSVAVVDTVKCTFQQDVGAAAARGLATIGVQRVREESLSPPAC